MIICDGCNVRKLWEHRCHGTNANVRGKATGKPCECQECKLGETFTKGKLTVEQFKLACISDTEINDAKVEILMHKVVLESESDVVEFCAILRKYRPCLEKKFFRQVGGAATK